MDNNNNGTPRGMRLVFGIFMVLVYLGVGILFFCHVFDIINYGVSIAIGVILCLYGLYRGYRLYKGQTY